MWNAVEAMGWRNNIVSGGGFDPQNLWVELIYRPLGLMDLDGVGYYDIFEQIIAANKLPVQEQIDESRAIEIRLAQNGGPGPMAAIILPTIVGVVETDVRNRAYLRTVILALAAARYKADKGEYPDTADALVPDYLASVPVDPCGGDPIRYRKRDRGFVAYSLGRNNTDDGGKETENQKGWKEGDLTFTVERPE